ncbi:MAG: acyl carrier protein [Waddliaceae bacterium]
MEKEQIFSILKKNVCEVMTDLDESLVTKEESLRNLGTNSVDRADILMQTMEMLQVNIPMVEFASAQNIDEIVQVFEQGCKNKGKA